MSDDASQYSARLDVRDGHVEVIVYRSVPYKNETEQVTKVRARRGEDGSVHGRTVDPVEAEHRPITVGLEDGEAGGLVAYVALDGEHILKLKEIDVSDIDAPQQYHLVPV